MFLIRKLSGMVVVFCSIVAYMCGASGILVCCDTVLPYETEMTGWFVVYYIQQSQELVELPIWYGYWGNVRECIYLQELSKG